MRLIDADTKLSVLMHDEEWFTEEMTVDDLISKFADETPPTIDAVPVIRCKDCKNRNRYECDRIRLGETKCGVTDDWFCADGERKEE